MPIFSASSLGSALAALIILTPAAAGATDGTPAPYASATEAYRQGASAMKSGEIAAAVVALEYAAKRGVLGAQLKLARLYAEGHDVPRDDAKAFYYFQRIADQYADIPPSSPIAKYVGEAFVALGRYYVDGIKDMTLMPDPAYAAGLFRHAGSYFGNAEAQYQLGRLYVSGTGVEKNVALGANWLAMATRKQHAGAQALLGELLWRGDGISQRPARGLALLTLAHENETAGRDSEWIDDLYQDAFASADNDTRKEAEALLPQLGGPQRASAMAAKATPKAPDVAPTTRAVTKSVAATPALSAPNEPQLGPVDVMPPAAMGMSVGFGASGDGLGGIDP